LNLFKSINSFKFCQKSTDLIYLKTFNSPAELLNGIALRVIPSKGRNGLWAKKEAFHMPLCLAIV